MEIATTKVVMTEEALAAKTKREEEQRQRVAKRIERLAGELQGLEQELTTRNAAFEGSVSDLDEAAKRNAASIQDAESEITRHRSEIERLKTEVEEAEQKVVDLKAALQGEEDSLARVREGKTLVEAMLSDARTERSKRQVAFELSTKRLRKDIRSKQAELGRARGYNGLTEGETP